MELSRRTFLKGAALGAAGVASIGALSGCASDQTQSGEEINGISYTASAKGCHGPITVTAIIEEQTVKSLEAQGPLETPKVGGLALSNLPQKIIEANSLSVDVVSGATLTSTAILKATGYCLTQAGIPVEVGPLVQSYKAGTYEAAYKGHMGPVSISTTFTADRIEKIELGEHTETPSLITAAFSNISVQVIEEQSLAVDAVTSATYSSRALLQGIEDCVVQAGGNPAELKHPLLSNPTVAADEEMTTEVVIVGGGTCGSIALYRLAQEGLDVVCVESTPAVGGLGEIAGFATMLWYGSQKQKDELGLSDADMDAVIHESILSMIAMASTEVDGRMLSRCATECGPMIDMLADAGMQMEVVDAKSIRIPIKGERFQFLHEKARELGAQTLLSHRVDELLVDEDGSVAGVVATRNDGSHLTIRSKVVILCAGGSCGNEQMMLEYYPDYVDTVENCATPSHDGSALQAAWTAGAAKGFFGVHAHNHTLPLDAKYAGISTVEATNDVATLGNIPLLWIDREGKRFANEEHCYGPTPGGNIIFFAKRAFNVLDQATVDALMQAPTPIRPWRGTRDKPLSKLQDELTEGEETGFVFKGDTLEALAGKTGWNPATIKEEIERYNSLVEAKDDKDYFKAPENLVFTVLTPPFYAVEIRPRCLGSFGGLALSRDYEVRNDEGHRIDGLYAAGDLACGWFGKLYPDILGLTSYHNTTSGYVVANSVITHLKK
jgi:fumarate reductase flavoprotein subunit